MTSPRQYATLAVFEGLYDVIRFRFREIQQRGLVTSSMRLMVEFVQQFNAVSRYPEMTDTTTINNGVPEACEQVKMLAAVVVKMQQLIASPGTFDSWRMYTDASDNCASGDEVAKVDEFVAVFRQSRPDSFASNVERWAERVRQIANERPDLVPELWPQVKRVCDLELRFMADVVGALSITTLFHWAALNQEMGHVDPRFIIDPTGLQHDKNESNRMRDMGVIIDEKAATVANYWRELEEMTAAAST